MILRLWVQTPLGAIFDEIYFLLYNVRSVRYSDRNAYHETFRKTTTRQGGYTYLHNGQVYYFHQSTDIGSHNNNTSVGLLRYHDFDWDKRHISRKNYCLHLMYKSYRVYRLTKLHPPSNSNTSLRHV